MTDRTDGQSVAAHLRMPFPPEHVGKLPRVTCGKCSDKKNRAGTCDEHPRKERCKECKAWVSPKHIHIDYVGHADVTARLLEADPEWNWEPVGTDEHGVPVLDTDAEGNPVGLWIRLTVGGITRLGYGSVPSSQGDAVKVLIGDALRNAAMRFGVALDLWAKGDRADPSAQNATASAGQAQRRRPQQRQEAPPPARPRPAEVPADSLEWGEWADAVNDISSPGEAQKVEDDLLQQFRDGKMPEAKCNAIQKAIHHRTRTIARQAEQGTAA